MGQRDSGRIINAPGKGSAALGVTQCGFEIPAAEVEHVQHAEQSRLVEYVAALFGYRHASAWTKFPAPPEDASPRMFRAQPRQEREWRAVTSDDIQQARTSPKKPELQQRQV